jgi:hypothetical protein
MRVQMKTYIDPKSLRQILVAIEHPHLKWWERLWRCIWGWAN